MKLAVKLTAALILGIVVVMATYAYVQIRQEVVLDEAALHRARHVALAWLGTIEAVWDFDGPARAREVVERGNARARDVNVRLVTLNGTIDGLPRAALTPDQLRELRAGAMIRLVQRDEAGDEWRHFYGAISVGGAHPAAVEFIEPLKDRVTFIHMTHLAIALATLAIVAACGAIAAGLQYGLVGRPLRLLRDKARRVGSGDFSGPVIIRQHDEMGDLAQEFNAMCNRLAEANRKLAEETEARVAALEQLRHTDRLATVGQLAAGVAHELGTPLSVISARAELIAADVAAPPDALKHARIIVQQSDRVAEIIQQLLDFSRRRTSKPGLVDLRHIVTKTLDLLSSAAERARVAVRCGTPDEPLLATVDQNQVQQALTNVVLNGIQAMPNGGVLRVDVSARHVAAPPVSACQEGMYFCICIADEGTGISPEHMSHIFDPFFTTKPVGEGTGLGLAVAHGIIAEHGGWIAVESEVGKGSRFVICLPQAAGGRGVAVA
jgi:two-component system NtrC family sensor kinase